MTQENKPVEPDGCCKNFADSACPCLDQKTGTRSCGPAPVTDGPEKSGGCCSPEKGSCAPKPRP